ncbi:MAG: hypothetical protein KBT19_00275 [Lachnospiraceae bacterium]|nr:hypothetical protein [Candidatus Colinaster equi]
MTNEEILAAVQNDQSGNGTNDEYEKNVMRRAIAYGTSITVIMCMLMVLAELFIFKKMDFGKPALIFAMDGCIETYDGFKGNNRKEKIKGIIELIFALFCIFLYLGEAII